MFSERYLHQDNTDCGRNLSIDQGSEEAFRRLIERFSTNETDYKLQLNARPRRRLLMTRFTIHPLPVITRSKVDGPSATRSLRVGGRRRMGVQGR